jgi:hypothetical protein
MEEIWDVDDVLENNTSCFVVKNTTLIYALSVVYHYIQQFNEEHRMEYDILFYAEPSRQPKNQFFIFTNFPYVFFLQFNPDYNLGE